MAKKLRIVVITVALIAVIAVIYLSGNHSYKQETPPMMADSLGLETEIPVIGVCLEPQSFSEILSVTGVLEAWNRSLISSETGGRIVEWLADIGDRLSKDRVIVQLDNRVAGYRHSQMEAALESAQIAEENSRRDLERQRTLHERGDLSQIIFEAIELSYKGAVANLKAAEAAEGLARRALEETQVKMPFKGHVAARLFDVGQSVPPGVPLVEVVQANPMRLKVSITEKELPRVKIGQEVRIILSTGDATIPGKIHAVGAAAEVITRLFPVEIVLQNSNLQLKPGMSVTAEIVTAQHPSALVVPRDAVDYKIDGATCFVVRGNRAQQQAVELGPGYAGEVMLAGGVTAGDTVVVVGMKSIKPGQRVNVKIENPLTP